MNIPKTIITALLTLSLTSCSSVPTALVSVVPPEKLVDEKTLELSREEGFISDAFDEAYDDFTGRTSEKVLMKDGNVCYSPLSLWYALALASEGASGETKTEIDSLLTGGREIAETDPANLRLRLAALLGNYDQTTLRIANSVWSASGLKEGYAKSAAEKYFSECYNVPAFNSDTAKSMSDWVSDKTKGTLKPDFDFGKGDLPEMIAILNTVYFGDEWTDKFEKSNNTDDVFHSPDGDITATYMHRGNQGGWTTGDGWVKASLGLKGSSMSFVLPTGEKTIRELLEENGLDTLLNGGEGHSGDINWSLPKFSYDTDLDFNDTLRSLGCEKMFSNDAEFQDMMDVAPLYISSVKGGTHIAVDEKGVTASAYTAIIYCGAMAPSEKLDMKLDRPFLWTITVGGTVLFVGIVSNPAA